MNTNLADLRPHLVTPWIATPEVRYVRTPLPPVPSQRLGADAAAPDWGDWLERKWYATTAAAGRLVWGGAARLTTGTDVPAESADPTAARAYLAAALERYAQVYAWPADRVPVLAKAIRDEGNAATVYDTIERVKAFGPPLEWERAESWYNVAGELQRVASIMSSGEAAGTVRTTAIAAGDAVARGAAKLETAAEGAAQALQENAGKAGAGLGLGLGLVAGGAFLVAFGPQLMAAQRARRALS